MSIGIIRKMEYRLLENAEFSEFSFTGFSGTIRKVTQRPNGNVLHTTTISLKAPEITETKTAQLDGLLFRKAQYRVTDGNGRIHLVGDGFYAARLAYEQGINGQPGSWNGYTITITHLSPESYPVSES
jgi:hypothetical protein